MKGAAIAATTTTSAAITSTNNTDKKASTANEMMRLEVFVVCPCIFRNLRQPDGIFDDNVSGFALFARSTGRHFLRCGSIAQINHPKREVAYCSLWSDRKMLSQPRAIAEFSTFHFNRALSRVAKKGLVLFQPAMEWWADAFAELWCDTLEASICSSINALNHYRLILDSDYGLYVVDGSGCQMAKTITQYVLSICS